MAETPKSTQEAEQEPVETVLGNAEEAPPVAEQNPAKAEAAKKIDTVLSNMEDAGKKDPVSNSEAVKTAKESLKKKAWKRVGESVGRSGSAAGYLLGRLFIYCARTVRSAFKFAVKAGAGGGKVGFAEGTKLGEEIFEEKNKKEK